METTRIQGEGSELALEIQENLQNSKQSQSYDPHDSVEVLKKTNDPYLETKQNQGEGNELAPEIKQSVEDGSVISQQILSITLEIDRLREAHLSLVQQFRPDYLQKPKQQQEIKTVEDET